MSQSIYFTLSFSEPQAHYVNVQMDIPGFQDQAYIDIKMPVWAPGSYLVREFAKNIESLTASNVDNKSLTIEKINKNTWRVFTEGSKATIKYAVYGFESSVRTSFINDEHAFLSPVGVFMHLENALQLPAHVQVILPQQWKKVSTGLEPTDRPFCYYAPNFDILYDSPLEIGNQETWSFDIDGVKHECAMVGKANYDKHQLTTDITKIVLEENKIWGSNPNNYYVFITHHYQNGSGGLEHLNSTVLATSRFNYQQPMSYKAYLSLVAHEYFHLWNVKRLRPKALGPFNYDVENYTTGLWIMEGFTAYFDNLIIRRCGFYSETEYLQQLAIDFNTVYNRPGYMIQSAAAASFDTWIKQYRPDENSANTSISYYNKGAMLAMAIDLKIIVQTNGKMRLDDVLKAAYQHFYLIENKGFEEADFQRLAEELTGVDLSEIFQAAYALHELDYNTYFNAVGYEMIDNNQALNHLSLGIKLIHAENRSIVKQVDRNSGAWIAGLNVDDEVLGVNGYRTDHTGKAFDFVMANIKSGEKVALIISRDGLIKHIDVPVMPNDKKSFSIQQKSDATEQEKQFGKIWLSLT